jgi:tetratricopeptide (TPR) repeat protein
MPRTVYNPKLWRLTTALLLVIVISAFVFFVWDFWGSSAVFSASRGQPAIVRSTSKAAPSADDLWKTAQTRMADTEKQLDVDEKRLDALRARAADIQLFVTILLGLGTLYAAAQAAFAYLNVQALVKAARDEANDQKEKWEKFQEDCRKQFPRFAGMDQVRASILGVLGSILRTKDSDENLFNRLDVEDRQRVFFYEKSIAGLEFLNLNQTPEDSVKVFRELGRFYIDKYKFENKSSKDDLDRGEFYFQLALERKNDDYRVLNDQGMVQADIYSDFKQAEKLWKRSIDKDPGQQRAYYDLGTLSFQSGDFDNAVARLREGTKRDRWEEERNEANEGNLYFNLTCALWKKAVRNNIQQQETDTIIATLKKAVSIYPKLRTDIPADPDLKDLMNAVGGEQELFKRIDA